MKSYLADTNFLLRYLLSDIPEQASNSRKYLEKARDEKLTIFIPELVIVEINFVLIKIYQQPKQKVTKVLTNLIEMPYLNIENRQQLLTALSLYRRRSVSLIDCLFIAKAAIANHELLTYDQKLLHLSLSHLRNLSRSKHPL